MQQQPHAPGTVTRFRASIGPGWSQIHRAFLRAVLKKVNLSILICNKRSESAGGMLALSQAGLPDILAAWAPGIMRNSEQRMSCGIGPRKCLPKLVPTS